MPVWCHIDATGKHSLTPQGAIMSRIIAAIVTAAVALTLASVSVPSSAEAKGVSTLSRGGGDSLCC